MTPEQLTEARKIVLTSEPTNGIALMVAHIDAQAAEIERLQHQADQADQIDVRGIVDALSWMGVSTPEGGTEAAAARLGRLVNYLSAAVLRHKIDHLILRADLSCERAAHEETRLARNRARLDGIAEARANLRPEIERLSGMLQKARDGLSCGLWDYGPGQSEHDQCDELIAEIDGILKGAK